MRERGPNDFYLRKSRNLPKLRQTRLQSSTKITFFVCSRKGTASQAIHLDSAGRLEEIQRIPDPQTKSKRREGRETTGSAGVPDLQPQSKPNFTPHLNSSFQSHPMMDLQEGNLCIKSNESVEDKEAKVAAYLQRSYITSTYVGLSIDLQIIECSCLMVRSHGQVAGGSWSRPDAKNFSVRSATYLKNRL